MHEPFTSEALHQRLLNLVTVPCLIVLRIVLAHIITMAVNCRLSCQLIWIQNARIIIGNRDHFQIHFWVQIIFYLCWYFNILVKGWPIWLNSFIKQIWLSRLNHIRFALFLRRPCWLIIIYSNHFILLFCCCWCLRFWWSCCRRICCDTTWLKLVRWNLHILRNHVTIILVNWIVPVSIRVNINLIKLMINFRLEILLNHGSTLFSSQFLG